MMKYALILNHLSHTTMLCHVMLLCYPNISLPIFHTYIFVGWNIVGGSDAMKLLPGPLMEITQSSSSTFATEDNLSNASHAAGNVPFIEETSNIQNSSKSRILLVFVIGGITYLEIAALRYLSRDPSFPYTIMMASTSILNGNTLLQSLTHQLH